MLFSERIALAEFFTYLLNYRSEEEIREYISTIAPLELNLNDTEIYFNEICKCKVPSALFLFENGGRIEVLPVLEISFELPEATHTDRIIDLRTRGNNNVLPVEWTVLSRLS